MSITKTLLELNKLEEQDAQSREDTELGFTAPAWIVEGIEIEYQQYVHSISRVLHSLSDLISHL